MEQYWKIPSYREITLHLRPHGSPRTTYVRLVAAAEYGWSHYGWELHQSSVWNPVSDEVLFSPVVKWAEIEFDSAAREGEEQS